MSGDNLSDYNSESDETTTLETLPRYWKPGRLALKGYHHNVATWSSFAAIQG